MSRKNSKKMPEWFHTAALAQELEEPLGILAEGQLEDIWNFARGLNQGPPIGSRQELGQVVQKHRDYFKKFISSAEEEARYMITEIDDKQSYAPYTLGTKVSRQEKRGDSSRKVGDLGQSSPDVMKDWDMVLDRLGEADEAKVPLHERREVEDGYKLVVEDTVTVRDGEVVGQDPLGREYSIPIGEGEVRDVTRNNGITTVTYNR